jgi:hypothetical protein
LLALQKVILRLFKLSLQLANFRLHLITSLF